MFDKFRSLRRQRQRVTTRQLLRWMKETMERAGKAALWKNSRGWLERSLRREGITRRSATNKRPSSPEEMMGPCLGWMACLMALRKANPGLYGPETTFSTDSVPLCFGSESRRTLDEKGARRVSMKVVAGSGKRTASLHMTITGVGPQPFPMLLLRGARTPDGKPDRAARAAELASYAKFDVHVDFQKKAWMDEVTFRRYLKFIMEDFERMGIAGSPKMAVMDNLPGQCSAESVRCCEAELNARCVFGPAGGTDFWQAIDHGYGHEYQTRIGSYYEEWMQSREAADLLRAQVAPAAPVVRGLLVEWTHKAYHEIEDKRKEAEAASDQHAGTASHREFGWLVECA